MNGLDERETHEMEAKMRVKLEGLIRKLIA
jgi:hypothetical protein